MSKKEKSYLSTAEAAELLGVSRMTIVRKIKEGEIPAEKVGKSYIIPREQLPGIFKPITPREKKIIEAAVRRVLKEYGDVIRRLGNE